MSYALICIEDIQDKHNKAVFITDKTIGVRKQNNTDRFTFGEKKEIKKEELIERLEKAWIEVVEKYQKAWIKVVEKYQKAKPELFGGPNDFQIDKAKENFSKNGFLKKKTQLINLWRSVYPF